MSGAQTVLFIDEVHRFSKTQQDALLPAVENRWVSFIGATTENPFFSVVSPAAVPVAAAHPAAAVTTTTCGSVISRALADPRGLGGAVALDDEAADHLVRLAGGDARRALTYLEAAALGLPAGGRDRHAGAGARGGPGRGPLRPGRRPALRRDQRVHQVHAGQRRRRGAALPGADDRGGGGPAVHRPAADRARQRGRRHGRPDRAADRRRRRAGRGVRRPARGADQPGPGGDPHLAGARSPTRSSGHRGGRGRRQGRAGRARCPRTCATRTILGRARLGHGEGYRVPARLRPRASCRSSTPPTRSADRRYYEPSGTAWRPGSPNAPSGSGTSSQSEPTGPRRSRHDTDGRGHECRRSSPR